MFLLSCFCCC